MSSYFASMDQSDRDIVPGFKLEGYLQRIGLDAGTVSTAARDAVLLNQVITAHLEHIPFENFDCVLGRGVDLTKVYDKLVEHRRGGYCFEQNSLMYEALTALGFSVTRKMCRVILVHPYTPYTHIALIVTLKDESNNDTLHLVDVGFGTGSPPGTLRADTLDTVQTIRQYEYRIVADGGKLVADGGFVLESFRRSKFEEDRASGSYEPGAPTDEYWQPFYVCDMKSPVFDSQLTLSSFYVANYMGSANFFTRRPYCASRTVNTRKVLQHNEFVEYGYEADVEVVLKKIVCKNIHELQQVLQEHFGIDLAWDHRKPDEMPCEGSPLVVPEQAEFLFPSPTTT